MNLWLFIKNMRFKYLFAVFSVVFLSDVVFADGENDNKGLFPYMGFIYYSDESVVDSTGKRFLRGAILIEKDWLITSAVPISDNVNDVGFPRKTLLARFGAVAIDAKFTLNEDEDEQEREIIQIIRPFNHSATQWWRTDITLMQTLLPFNLTPAVNLIPPFQPTRSEKQCFILIYVRRHPNTSEDRVLIQTSVELLPPSIENCGSHYFEQTMTCASDSEETKNELFEPNTFCQGNSGGPLICDGVALALQTYIDNNCKAPHLYQLLSPWHHFLNCAINNKCDERDCADQCIITNKDAPLTLESSSQTSSEAEISPEETSVSQDTTTTTMLAETTLETSEVTVMTSSNIPITLETETTTKVVTEETHETTTEAMMTSTVKEETEQQLQALEQPREQPQEQSQEPHQEQAAALPMETPQPRAWPKEKEESKKQVQEEECEDAKRRTNVEAQQDARQNTWQEEPSEARKKKRRSAAERNMCVFQTVLYAVILARFL